MPVVCRSLRPRSSSASRFQCLVPPLFCFVLVSFLVFAPSSFAQSPSAAFAPEAASGLPEAEDNSPPPRARHPASFGRAAAQARRDAAPVAQPTSQPPQRPLAIAGPTTLGLMTGGLDGTFAQIGSDITTVVGSPDLRVVALLGKGSLQNLGDLLNLRGVDLALVGADTARFAEARNIYPGLRGRLSYIAKLYDQEVHVIGGPEIRSLADLAGKVVNADVAGSGTLITATAVFEAFGLPVKLANDPPSVGLEKLKQGEISAVIYVVGKPGRLFSTISPNSGLHLIPVEASEALLQTYVPATLTSADYPALVKEGGTVETIAVPVLLTAYNWSPDNPRYQSLSAFSSLFFERFQNLLQPPYHAKWLDVNLRATVPGWRRAPYAQEALDRTEATMAANKAEKEGFTKWAAGIGLTDMTSTQHEQLLNLWKLGQKRSQR